MTDQNESFFQEVDEQLRQDRLMKAFKRWGPWAGGALALVLVVVFGWIEFQNYQVREAGKQSDLFDEALKQVQGGDLDAATAQFAELSEKGPKTYRVMAMMERAALLEQRGDLAGAVTAFDAAAEASTDPIMRDSARIRAAYIVADTQDLQALKTRLQPIIDAKTPFSFLARELLGLKAWDSGDAELARSTLENITLAFDAPESVRQRAQLLLAVIGPAPESADAGGDASTNAANATAQTNPAGETK